MDAQQQWGVLGLAFALGVGLSWVATRWWFTRKLRQAARQQERLEKAREFAAQQASQARKQIETLQHDFGELRLKMNAKTRAHREEAAAAMPAGPEVAEEPARPGVPTDGFAETQVLMPPRR